MIAFVYQQNPKVTSLPLQATLVIKQKKQISCEISYLCI